jgi:cytochrome P450
MSEAAFNPFEPEQLHAWPLLKELRAQAPVVQLAEGMYYVTRHAEARDVLRDHENFSSAAGFRAPGVEVPSEDRMLGEQDPPQHTFVRKVMASALRPAAVRAEEGFIRASARQLLGRLTGVGTVDLVEGYTILLPNLATVHLLGFPMKDADQIAAWTREVMESEWPAMNQTERGEGFVESFPDFAAYIDRTVADHRERLATGDDPDDVVSRLMSLEVEGQFLTDRQVRALIYNLLLGGMTTTSQLLGNLLYQILTDPELQSQLREDPGLVPNAVEESMRMHPPVMIIPRGCVRETKIGDLVVRPGERVIVGTACVNRDEQRFSDSESFVCDREKAGRHLTFGYGIHQCVGAQLARTVGVEGVTTFLGRYPSGSVALADGYEFENVPTFFEYGPRRLPVVMS